MPSARIFEESDDVMRLEIDTTAASFAGVKF